jgi:hypothetical protein
VSNEQSMQINPRNETKSRTKQANKQTKQRLVSAFPSRLIGDLNATCNKVENARGSRTSFIMRSIINLMRFQIPPLPYYFTAPLHSSPIITE